ncbi:hypothetical protein [Actinoplanes derwentensis]|uniref:Esterase-like activity of phytase family protein n=1 Tax=Actinoplanes derwentensis TaxID=113562 RepID=A0A1H1UQB2_9ACTN|nr:hypothetical protein [Actinoplanes derwentensis]GID88135.1 hypothetical protein Ade03nite_70590 [Actinoplanes derwentensis]SDS74695.1 hypothetical protein SAMN04489716_1512 [Actinoplanes derwentensis]
MTFLTTAVLSVSLTAVPIPMAAAPQTTCTVKNDLLDEISGLAADGDGYVVVNDGADDPNGRKIFFLNRKCKVTDKVSYPSQPRDTEDLARGADGTIWVGDIGDNSRVRETIGVWRLKPGGKSPTLFRMSYPDGAHDAEALLVGSDGVPIMVTKDPLTAGVYVPAGPLTADGTTPLRRAGDFTIPITATSNPYGFKGRLVVTGGAVSADGRRIALRTYADAFEFDVPEGQTDAEGLVKTISGGTARTVALPDEPQGESIAYSADGSALLTISEMADGLKKVDLLSHPLDGVPAAAQVTTEPTKAAKAAPASNNRELPTGALIAGGALAIAAGLIGLVIARLRRRR